MLDKKIRLELQDYIDKHLKIMDFKLNEEASLFSSQEVEPKDLEDYIANNRKASFAEVLFSFIDEKELSDPVVYKKAGIDRKHFSKIRSNPQYRISKHTAVSLAIALKLNITETKKLLHSAGFSLSDNDTFDLIIQFFLEKEIYDMDQVNLALDYVNLT